MDKKKKIKKEDEKDVLQDDVVEEEVILSKEQILEAKVKELEAKVVKYQNDYLKEKADLANTKKRLEKERITERKYAAMSICKKLVSPLDNFELALSHPIEDEAVKNFLQGFKMIQDQIKKEMESEGVSEIDALNEEYDPNFHQAIMTEKQEGTEANTVIEVLQKGYMFKDRVVRPAIVKISE